MWDLVPWPEIKPGPPVLGAWSLSHWTTREAPNDQFLVELNSWFFFFFFAYIKYRNNNRYQSRLLRGLLVWKHSMRILIKQNNWAWVHAKLRAGSLSTGNHKRFNERYDTGVGPRPRGVAWVSLGWALSLWPSINILVFHWGHCQGGLFRL